ncbi:MAG: hypothetical protein K2M41_04240 [Muribaculaceae bacterium]|nr:hypothetical protein [Muribaculaceae bacterium]
MLNACSAGGFAHPNKNTFCIVSFYVKVVLLSLLSNAFPASISNNGSHRIPG